MTENIEKRTYQYAGQTRFQALLCAVLCAVFAGAVTCGMTFFGGSGEVLALPELSEEIPRYTEAVFLCVFDVAGVFLITLAYTRASALVVSVLVSAVRGVAFGAAVAFCTENAVPGRSLAVIVSFAAVSLMFIAYAVFINRSCSGRQLAVRLLCYFAASGAAVILRLLPYLLIYM